MRTTLAVILGVMALISASGCDNLYYDITDELNANYFHGTRQFVASDGAADDWFGCSVAVSSDGSTVVVGAYSDDDKGSGSGSAYVYRWNGSSWVETKLVASDGAADDYFGYSVAVSSDGSTVVVGAQYDDDKGTDSGSAYVYRWNGSSWVETKLSAGDGSAGDQFGQGVAVSEDGSAIVGGAYLDDVGSNSSQGSVWIFAE